MGASISNMTADRNVVSLSDLDEGDYAVRVRASSLPRDIVVVGIKDDEKIAVSVDDGAVWGSEEKFERLPSGFSFQVTVD